MLPPTNAFAGKAVCVTGAAGSIGSQICRRLLELRVSKLVLLSLTESGLYRLMKQLGPIAREQDCELVPVLGSCRNPNAAARAVAGVQFVLHAGAHKHVPLCEQNPLEAIENNVLGTLVMLGESGRAGVEQFVLISSDKAVQPASIMGATKRIGELMVLDGGASLLGDTRAAFVRFGNVLDSDGSVLPLWREQIAAGGPLTLTDSRCERYFMSIPDAVGLVLDVAGAGLQGGFVLDMGEPRRMLDLAHELIAESGGIVEIRETGLRPGEKLTEELNHGGELVPTKFDKIRRINERREERLSQPDLSELMMLCVRGDHSAIDRLWELVNETV
jgi:FlaA1/EpsC-like NDP-sugar epimerase